MRCFNFTKSQKKVLYRALRHGDIRFLCKAFLFHTRLSHYFYIERLGYKMRVWYTPFAFWLWTHPSFIRDDELFLERFLREGDIVIDGGANIGILTLLAARLVKESGKVYSFEPHPRTFSYLKQNIESNKYISVTVIQKALSNRAETLFMTDEYVSDINRIQENASIAVETVRLENVIDTKERITLLKLDVEGYELFALEGARGLLDKVEVIFFESAPRNLAAQGATQKDIYLFLEREGFGLYKIDMYMKLSVIDKDYATTTSYENLVATKNIDFLESRLRR